MLSRDQFVRAMPAVGRKPDLVARYFEPLVAAMMEFGITTPVRIAAFLAQVGHESLDFKYMEEIASGAAYDHRADLGNTRPEAINAARAHNTTPGRFYKGHGPIQITGYANHRACGEALGVDAVNRPELLATAEYGFRAAGWFWHLHGLNALADRGDFEAITRRINGGLNGQADRVLRWKRATAALASPSIVDGAVGATAAPVAPKPQPLAATGAATAGAAVAGAGVVAATTGHSWLAIALVVVGAVAATVGLAWLAVVWLTRNKEE